MSGRVERTWLDKVDQTSIAIPHTLQQAVIPIEYSRFKYGDGEIAHQYGSLLAEKMVEEGLIGEGKHAVTSSAYKVAPPASHSMLGSFVSRARELAPQAIITPFKIDRHNLTEGDYASMGIEEREQVMEKNGLSMPVDFDTDLDSVVALDDILVTGSHEKIIHQLFMRSGLSETQISYAYILKVAEGSKDPRIEAAINHCAIRSLANVAKLNRETASFVPNARICKMIVSSSPDEIIRFCDAMSDATLETISQYIEGDNLDDMEAYHEGVDIFRQAYMSRKTLTIAQ